MIRLYSRGYDGHVRLSKVMIAVIFPMAVKGSAIFLLLEGKTISEVASELGASRTTIYRWKNNDRQFIEELNRLKQSACEAGKSKLIAARTAAIDTAIELLAHEDTRIQLRAIDTILRFDATPTMGGGLILRRGSWGCIGIHPTFQRSSRLILRPVKGLPNAC